MVVHDCNPSYVGDRGRKITVPGKKWKTIFERLAELLKW
jgi:hypothetical protein